ncbi:hypothetical protein BDN72DRAFT_843569 [Pluteus cervinus]|uniref:Uncharacterized protein n=1 Tax=Pluteus cervinus TaxID=181527 RepID=A0ACD3ANF3_9AGAR|nr:hypothetical protein BDN72DRAFT_843569 [Pluteus cervinus]
MHNVLSPISRLHPELLLCILKEVMNYSSNNDAVLLFTWICRHWRCTVLDTPLLWNEIRTTNTDFLQECISRSRHVPLTFRIHVAEPGYPDPIPTVLRCLPRTQRLHLSGDSVGTGVWPEEDINLWKRPAPLLKFLKVSGFAFPATLFSGCAPTLQTLHLTKCAFDPENFPPLPELRSLSIIDAPYGIPVWSVLDMLQTLPHLHSLVIRESLREEAFDQKLRLLPELRQLSLQSEVFGIVHEILTHITIPATAKIRIWVDQLKDTVEDEDNLRIVNAMLGCRVPSEMTIRSLHILSYEEGHEYSIIERNKEGEHVSIRVRFDGDTDMDIIEDILSILDLDDLEVLKVTDQYDNLIPSNEFWLPFCGLKNLQTVKLCTGFATNFVVHLFLAHRPLWDIVLPRSDPDLVLDGCEELAAATLSFKYIRTLVLEHFVESPQLDSLTSILGAVLRVRLFLNRRLGKLTVHGLAPMEEQEVSDLEYVVGKFTYHPLVRSEDDQDTATS